MTAVARNITVMICRAGEGVLDEYGTIIRVTDEGAGEYLTLEPASSANKIGVTKEEWPVMRDTIEMLIGGLRD